MKDLIDRLEKATGPDRELDGLIWWSLDHNSARRAFWNASVGRPKDIIDLPKDGLGRMAVIACAPRYTGSFDAAWTMVPKGFGVHIDDRAADHTITSETAYAAVRNRPKAIEAHDRGDVQASTIEAAHHESAIIALCIACLKARQQ